MSDADLQTQAPTKKGAPVAKAAKRVVTFDPSRDHGKVYSATGHPKAHYFQNGMYFDGQGDRVAMPGDAQREKVDAAARDKQREQKAAALRRQADAVEKGEDIDDVTGDAEIDGVNLKAWAVGDTPYRFGAVREAIQIRFSRSVHNEDDARDFLVDQKVMSQAELNQYRIRRKRSR